MGVVIIIGFRTHQTFVCGDDISIIVILFGIFFLVRLIPLLCTRCQAPIPAQPDEVAWICQQCGQGLLIDGQTGVRLQDFFFSDRLQPGLTGRPFWVSNGRVVIQLINFSHLP